MQIVTDRPHTGPPRMADVATVAGVSMKTVSNVINGVDKVSAPTRQRVLSAIDEIGYLPNLSARNLARGRAGVIALVVPGLELPYFASLAGKVVEAAERRGWLVLIHQTGGDAATERAALEGNFAQRIDGLIVSSQTTGPEELAARASTVPLVMLGNRAFDPGTPHVDIDNHGAGKMAVQHLVAGGCRRIAMIGASSLLAPAPRTQGFLEALQEHGLPLRPDLLRQIPENTGDAGESATEDLLECVDELPDGIVAITDWVAQGVMRALLRHEVRIPQDVAVIGFDDIPYARTYYPSLTSIAPDRRQVAARALDVLDRLISHPSDRVEDVEARAPLRLLVRESTRTPS
ncbi:hypothetical protein BH708_10730 [Brachybacterium sp. P6-10-X1]|nr:hypothetical protein BH708_10730 [Brachybacterium sp. P6-10-X1]